MKLIWDKGSGKNSGAVALPRKLLLPQSNMVLKTQFKQDCRRRAEPDNIASCIILEKCRMTFIVEGKVDSHLVKVYEMHNPGFAS